ncbi:SGNH/GDSL hydrolase family protein [Hoeflea sp. YIM 152468]|uniref:SGNH/GDSL hydrolase family protein n=1 Tax=Hoeflea sp. YIM 152468 TaxID=3031759 RepID=UPI0023DB0BF8|nr:SGNH/GDSL hydrolase family protein [Hoeflea sp. YIM 152468]MDF1607928.1 SGNH/GDSL hydrolase family protein [Hoeflea sp. YIM 152468]
MNHFLAGPISWVLAPLALAKGLGVRKIAPRLPPPVGRLRGQAGTGAAEIRLLVIGDSSAAGVGASRIEDTLGPQLATSLHQASGKAVSWRIAGANSAIAAQIRDHVIPNIEERDFTHVVVTVGTNDAKNFVSRSAFKKGFGGLLYAAHARWPDAKVFWSPVVSMSDFPALPPTLKFILGLRVGIINATGAQLCRERYATAVEPLPVEGPEGFAIDGFHANALGYRHWAQHLTRFMLAEAPAPSSLQRSE